MHTCLRREADGKQKTKVVENGRDGVTALIEWLARQGVAPTQVHAVLEATGVDHELTAEALHAHGFTVSIVNPAQAKSFARGLAVRTQTDAVDAETLARWGAWVQPASWTPPPPEVRTLQALLARQHAVAEDRRRERNRLEKAQATTTPARVLTSLNESLTFLETALTRRQQPIDDHLKGHPHLKADVALLIRIPAVGPKVAQPLLALLHARSFRSAEQRAASLGLVPVERPSGTSVHARARLAKAGPTRVRATLYRAAVVAIRYNPHVKALYERLLARGKAKMAALGAAMRKLVHLCFGVFKNRRPYQADYAAAA